MQKRRYITPEVTAEYFLVREYMMWSSISDTIDPAPPRRDPAF